MSAGQRNAFVATETRLAPSVADPAVLGLTGLAVAALVLAAIDLGWTSGAKALVIPWTLMMRASAQSVAGLTRLPLSRSNLGCHECMGRCTVQTSWSRLRAACR